MFFSLSKLLKAFEIKKNSIAYLFPEALFYKMLKESKNEKTHDEDEEEEVKDSSRSQSESERSEKSERSAGNRARARS